MISSSASSNKRFAMLDEVTTIEAASVFDALDVGVIILDRHGTDRRLEQLDRARHRISRAASVLGKSLVDVFPGTAGHPAAAVIDDSFEVGSSSILTHSLNNLLPLRGEAGEQLLHNIVVRPVASGRVAALPSADQRRDHRGDTRTRVARTAKRPLSRDRRYGARRDHHDQPRPDDPMAERSGRAESSAMHHPSCSARRSTSCWKTHDDIAAMFSNEDPPEQRQAERLPGHRPPQGRLACSLRDVVRQIGSRTTASSSRRSGAT